MHPIGEISPPASDVRFIRFGDRSSKQRPLKFVIDGVMLRRSTVGLVGPSGAMKSLVAADICATIALGAPWFGRQTRQGAAFMLLGEGNAWVSRRLVAYGVARARVLSDAPLFYTNKGDDLSSMAVAEFLSAKMARTCDRLKVCPGIVCIDPLAKAMGSGDENNASDVNRLLENVDRWFVQRLGCTALLVHHTGHGNLGRARGSSAFKAGIDTEIVISRDGNALSLKCTKQKDLEEFGQIDLVAQEVKLPWKVGEGGSDCGIALAEGTAPPQRAAKQHAAIETLRRLCSETKSDAVAMKDWRAALADDAIVVKAKAFEKLRARLKENGRIDVLPGSRVRLAKGAA